MKHHTRSFLYFSLGWVVLQALWVTSNLAYADTEFNSAFLHSAGLDASSLEVVEKGYALQPGDYSFTVFMNQEQRDMRLIRFYKDSQQQQVLPCLDQQFLTDYGVLYDPQHLQQQNHPQCIDVARLIDQASVSFDAGLQQLHVSIPQLSLQYRPKGYISPKLFDEGINALSLSYDFSGIYTRHAQYGDHYNLNVLLNSGFNVGAWRYRNLSSLMMQRSEPAQWRSQTSRIERNILPWRARLVLGDTATSNDLFDSFSFRGVQLSSDDLQLAYSLQNYAPVVRGVAHSNASVEIRQNGYLIYSLNVAPGAFEIKDLVTANDSGDLYISVIESDGSKQQFIQSYAAVPKLMRAGQWRYGLSAGRYRSGNDHALQPYFAQASLGYGINNRYTPYMGLMMAEHYAALGLGLGLSMGQWGGLSTDLNFAQTDLAAGGTVTGGSVRFLYSKALNGWGSNLKIVGYRYSSPHYYDFADAVAEQVQWRKGVYEYQYDRENQSVDRPLPAQDRRVYAYSRNYYNKKNQIQLAFSQRLGKFGQAYSNWTSTEYWHGGPTQSSWQLGYSNYIKRIALSLYYQSTQRRFFGRDYSVGLNLNIPLDGRRRHPHNYTSSSSLQHDHSGVTSLQTGLSGSFLKDHNLQLQSQFDLSHSRLSLNAAYQGNRGNFDVGYQQDRQQRQFSSNLSGGLLLHAGGLVMGPQMIGSTILVEAKGATGVRIENQSGLTINPQGYAILRSSSPYRHNRVSLQAEDLGANINLHQAALQDVVPTKDAIVKVTFDVAQGHSVWAEIVDAQQQPVVLGATLLNAKHQQVGMVGTAGMAYITGVTSQEQLLLRWGDEAGEQCHIQLPQLEAHALAYVELKLQCQ
jgi:outer membrane usher protein